METKQKYKYLNDKVCIWITPIEDIDILYFQNMARVEAPHL